MKTLLSLAFVLGFAACGGKSKPAEPDPAGGTQPATEVTTPPSSCDGMTTPVTAEDCECMGYHVVGDIGDGQVACPGGETEIARIQTGIEGGVCCSAVPPTPPAGAAPTTP